MQFEFVSFPQFNKRCERLVEKIKSAKLEIDYIVSIQRGGAVMSKIFSDFLERPIATITSSSYMDGAKKQPPSVTQEISVNVKDKNLLVLDEISDSGETLTLISKHLYALGAKKVTTATFFTKTGTEFIPDFWLENLDKWIVFPYEMEETFKSFQSLPNIDEKTRLEFKKYVEDHGLTTEFLSNLSL